jgi:hypothetical protein
MPNPTRPHDVTRACRDDGPGNRLNQIATALHRKGWHYDDGHSSLGYSGWARWYSVNPHQLGNICQPGVRGVQVCWRYVDDPQTGRVHLALTLHGWRNA